MKNRTAFVSGFALFVCFCLLTAMEKLPAAIDAALLFPAMLGTIGLAFFLPALLIRFATPKGTVVRLRTFLKISAPQVFAFSIAAGLATAILTFLINFSFQQYDAASPVWLSGGLYQSAVAEELPGVAFFFVIVLFPVICEEFFLRGAIFSVQESISSTWVCILFSGLCSTLLYGSTVNWVGPLLTGCLYAYMTYIFDCIWPAVFAHLLHVLYFLLTYWLTDTYSTFGIWKYYPGISIILLFAFSYLALHALETLLLNERIRHFRPLPEGGVSWMQTICNPGYLLLLLAFLGKAVFGFF